MEQTTEQTILSGENTAKENTAKASKLNVSNALLVIVGALIVISAIQIFQFQQLANAVSNGAIKVNAQTGDGSTGGAANVPSQVGGCG
jgi:hypothetical protein